MSTCHIDVIDACHMKCPTCVKGVRQLENTVETMDFGVFEAIVAKARAAGYDTIGLYNWSEPFLTKRLPRYIQIVKAHDARCEVSTTSSFTKREELIKEAMLAGLDTLLVSVSGLEQAVYVVNHKNGNIGLVRKNLEMAAGFVASGAVSTRIRLRMIKFEYNAGEEGPLRAYAASLPGKVDFEIVMGAGNPYVPIDTYAPESFYRDRLRDYSPMRGFEKNGEICPILMDSLSIDATGNVYLCCAYPNFSALKIGPYLDIPEDDLLMMRYAHPMCASCHVPRRVMTQDDRQALLRAMRVRLGMRETNTPPAHDRETIDAQVPPLSSEPNVTRATLLHRLGKLFS